LWCHYVILVTGVSHNVGTTDGFTVANPMGDAILGATALSVDPAASAACGFAIAIPMGDTTEA
jgi:hypothetical protein